MPSKLHIALLILYITNAAPSQLFESEEIVPVRIGGRIGGRFWKRSDEQPTFKLVAFGKDFTLNLTPDDSFLAPTLKIQRIKAKYLPTLINGTDAQERKVPSPNTDPLRDINTTEEAEEDLRSCFYSGTVDSNQDSVVAVSLCYGIQGSFITEGDEYLIEPKAFSIGERETSTSKVHVIRRRVFADTKSDLKIVFDQVGDESQGKLVLPEADVYSPRMPRKRRFVSAPRYVETLVVADASMAHFYGDEIKHYVLTLMSMTHRHPEHYDTAVFFTREDICGHKSCDTLGVADVGTMCDPKRSCSVIEDNGLQAAFTAAHELGHVLSMPHDDSKNCEQLFGDLGQHHMMAPLFIHLNKTQPWSPCSALYVTQFFDNGHGDCLLDKPDKTMPLPTELPGLTYDLDRQCQQVFGEDLPWADGTACGDNRTCLSGVCLPAGEVLQPKVVVDGSWGPWGQWGPCSRTCGGGVEFSHRECSDPEPQHGGKYCEGQRVKYMSCNTQPCPDNNGKSFREEQCEKYNSFNYLDFHGYMKQWIPKYAGVSPRDRCKLFCRAKGSSEFKVFEAKVIDGTTCSPDTTSICVQGQCVKAGCDLEIGSSKKLDKCGVCGGNGFSCRKITGSMNKATFGYSDIVTIPAGATNIDVKQRSHRGITHDGNYLAVRREGGVYILNGNFSVSTVEQDIPVKGAVLKYSGSSTTLERIQSFRQLQEPITIQLLATAGEASPPKVKYTFFIPKDVSFSKAKERKSSLHALQPFGVPQWTLGEWSECSKTCGSGWSRRHVECRGRAASSPASATGT
ncbi:hypothetical protein ANANG_G00233590 [Anguilla anguilla]|uniref:Peptidase M12B domain-containing protein n=1 Tax=Anguilla anguilla TaxID=7936 RepID=A0A9D3LUY4_ANGAN|nr:hypothetical protein ANANG_G00233590 [Anguilla anguilla]